MNQETTNPNGKMTAARLEQLRADIECYRQAIEDARDALAAAEMEMDAELDAYFQEGGCRRD